MEIIILIYNENLSNYMKHLNRRKDFLKVRNNKINETWDMGSGGPMTNAANWGDSLLGRLFNSAARKAMITANTVRTETIYMRIKDSFDDIIKSNLDLKDASGDVLLTKIYFLLDTLKQNVENRVRVKYLIGLTETIIENVKDVTKNVKISDSSKNDLLKQLEDFLAFLKGFDKDDGENGPDEKLTGVSDKVELETIDNGAEMKYPDMVSLLNNLKLIITNKDETNTTSQGKAEDQKLGKNVDNMLSNLITNISNILKTKNSSITFNNNLLKNSTEFYNDAPDWKLIEKKGDNQIIYRKNTENPLITINANETMTVFVPKINRGNSNGKAIDLKFNDKPETQTLPLTNENVEMVAGYIVSKLDNLLQHIEGLSLNANEIEWLNKNYVGKWLVVNSNSGNSYKRQITNFTNNIQAKGKPGIIKFSKDIGGINYKTIKIFIKDGKVFNDESSANKFYEDKYQDNKGVLGNDSKRYTIDSVTAFDILRNMSKVKDINELESLYNQLEKIISKIKKANDKRAEKDVMLGIKKYYDPAKKRFNEALHYNKFDILLEKTTLSGEEDYLNQALSNLKEQINNLIKGKDGISITSEFLSSIIKEKRKNIKEIKLFVNEIKNQFNSPTMPELSPLYKESIETITDAGKRQMAANLIARFAKRSLQFEEDPSLYGGLDKSLGDPLENFNDLFMKLLDSGESKPEKTTTESKLFRYEDFLLIREAEMLGSEVKINDSEKETVSEKIRLYFLKKVDYERWVIDKTQIIKMISMFEEAKKEAGENMEIMAEDLIAIARLFNKAYKLYTTSVIPSGRTNGQVSNKTFREYTHLGSSTTGSPAQPGNGPWRNNRIFNSFEKNVTKGILENKEYRPIFSKNTDILLTDGTKKPGGGNDLKLFITKIFDGDDLYSDDNSLQKEFLLKMFNIKDNTSTKTKEVPPEEKVEVEDKSNENKSFGFIETSKINTQKGSINALYLDGNITPLYFYIIETDINDNVYFKYSQSIGYFEKYSTDKINIEKGDFKTELLRDEKRYIYFGKIKKEDFKTNVDMKFKRINCIDEIGSKDSFRVLNAYTVVDNDNKEPLTVKIMKKSHVDKLKDDLDIKKLKEKLANYKSKK